MSLRPQVPVPAERIRKKNSIVVPNQPRWYHWIPAWLIFAAIRTVSATLRYHWQDNSGYFDNGLAGPAIYCVWHNRLALCMTAYAALADRRKSGSQMAAMVSASKDGAFLAAILQCFSVQPVRGSTSRRGPQALLELTTWAERGFDLAITPDGPRGPCYVVQNGAMSLAQITGLPIIPFSYYLKWKVRPNTWDRFQIPLPFSYCEMRAGKPIYVPREASDEERAELRRQLETTLRELSRD
jgi:lysophospholipid acyltransferase (LPLAT)-like uncharacterized protein